jgi:DNA-binding transcriptional LysR family regulator
MERMELYQLRSFATVAELGHLTRAAERLHVSQPALSAQIRALEEALGVTLFDRGSAGMALTAAGRQILPAAREVVAKAAALRGLAQSIGGDVAGRVRVATLADPEILRLGAVLNAARDRHPLLEIELHHEVSGEAFAKVRDGELDAAYYYGPLSHPEIEALRLRTLVYRVAAPAAWRHRVEGAEDAAIAALPWIMTPAISTHNALATHFFTARGLVPATVLEADNELVIRSLVVAGVGVALMREDLAEEAALEGAVCLWDDVRIETDLQFVWPAARRAEPPLAALIDLVRASWTGDAPDVASRAAAESATA